jgi:hypothetical protein
MRDVEAGGSIILVVGARKQHIGGPLPAATVIANFLGQYRDQSQRPQPFGGRDREFRDLDEWLQAPEQPYLLVASPPGRGKSALLARWCDRLTVDRGGGFFQIVFVPISVRFELNRAETVLRAIATRLAAVHDEPAFGDSVDDWRDLVGELMVRPPPPGTRLLVVVDGIDEAAGWRMGPSLWPNQPHPDVKLVVSARLTAEHPRPGDWLQDLDWPMAQAMELGPLSQEGVRDVLTHMGLRFRSLANNANAVRRLHEISAGDPLVVGLYVGHLWDSPLPGNDASLSWLGEADPGLTGFMERWWSDQKRLWDDSGAGTPISREVFDLLSCALGPLERRHLLQLARREQAFSGDDLDAALRAIDRLLVMPSPRAYAIAHPRLLEYRLSRLREDGDLGALDRLFIKWAEEALDRTSELPPSYVVRHYGEHLERSGAEPDEMTGLLSAALRSAWLGVMDDLTGWIDDIDRFYAAASRSDAVAITAKTRPQWPALRAWCTWLRAEANATYDLVHGPFAAVLVKGGFWPERRALTRCSHIPDSSERAKYLAALAPVLSLEGTHLASEILRGLRDADDEMAADAMAGVVSHLAALGDLSAAQAVAMDSDAPSVRAAGLIATLPALPEEEQLAMLLHLDRGGGSVQLSQLADRIDRELARRAFGDPPWRYLERQLCGHVHWWPAHTRFEDLDGPERAYAFEDLAPWMTNAEREDHIGACLDALAARGRPRNVDDAMSALAPYLNGLGWHRARAIVQKRLRGSEEFRANVSLLRYAPPDVSGTLLEYLSRSLPRLFQHLDSTDVRVALATLAGQGASAVVMDIISDLDEQDWDKAQYLASVAPCLDLAGVHEALEMVNHTRRETRSEALVPLLLRQAECGEVQAGLAKASTETDSDEMGTALSVLSVASGRQSFTGALPALLAIRDRQLRCAAAAVSARLSPPTGSDLLRIVSSFGDPNAADGLPMEVFALVGCELPADEWTDADTLQAGWLMVNHGTHVRKSQIMLDHFRHLAAACGVRATVEQARAYGSDTFEWPLTWAVVAVAPLLDPTVDIDRDELVSAGSESAAVVMAATLRLLSPNERAAELRNAIAVAYPAELRSHAAGLLLNALTDDLYELAANATVPSSLLDGQSRLAHLETWASQMADLCFSLDAGRLRRLLKTSRRVRSSSSRAKLLTAIAVRLGTLGEVDDAFACIDRLNPSDGASALQQLAAVVTPALLSRIAEEIQSRISHDYYRGSRALAMAELGRRIGQLPSAQISELLEQWHTRDSTSGQVLIDLAAYAPALLALGSPDAPADLIDRLTIYTNPSVSG